MLDPDYIQRLSEGAEEVASRLHTDILRRVIQRIMLRLQRKDDYLLTSVDKWQLETLQEAGFLREDMVKEIAKATGQQVTEIKRAFEDAGVKTIAWDNAVYKAAGLSPAPLLNSPQLLAILDRGYRKTLQEWRNYTGTTATAAQRLFIQVCDRAYNQVISGSLSYTQAVTEAVEAVSKSGVVVHYPTGWRDTIETATLRAVRTGVGQACAEMTEARMDELDWDIVLTSAHLGARYGDGGENLTNHAWWQGRFFSRSGKDKRFPPLSVCGMGDVQGLCGANCRHSIGPGDGENNPYKGYDSEENRKRYDLEQRQRDLERRIRNTKREVQGLKAAVDAADPETRPALEAKNQKKARLLQKQNEGYNQFCSENGLKPLQDRLKIAGWDRKQAASATAAAGKSLAKSSKSAIIVSGDTNMSVDIEIDKFTPCLRDAKTGEIIETAHSLATAEELKGLKKRSWKFNWSAPSLRSSKIYKLLKKGDTEIQGLVAIEEDGRNSAFHLSLAESAPHNLGTGKQYEGVGGHLFAIAVQKSIDAGYGGFIYFEAKNMELVKHYEEKFGAALVGMPHQYSMVIDEEAAARLVKAYTLN